jgi:hypothetical protein
LLPDGLIAVRFDRKGMAELSAGRTVRRVRTGVLGGRASAAPIVFYRLNAVHAVLGADARLT